MLVLLFVALWFILRGDLFYVLPCVILFLCFSVLLALRLLSLGKRELIAAVKIVVKQDARLSVKDIASCTGISDGSVQTILKKRLDLRKVCFRWVPDLLTEEQKTQRLKCARKLLKTYKGCNSRVISNLLTGDETWVHMLEPQRRADNKQWKRKDKKKTPMYCQENHKFGKDACCTQFSLIQVGQSFKCLVHLFIQSLADSTIILY